MLRHFAIVGLCLASFAACGTGAIQSNSPDKAGVDRTDNGFVGTPSGAGNSSDPNASTGDASTGASATSTGAASTATSTGGSSGSSTTTGGASSTSTGGGSSSSATSTSTSTSTTGAATTGGTATAGTTGGTATAGTTGGAAATTGTTTTGTTTGAPAPGSDGSGSLGGTVQGTTFQPQSATFVVMRNQVIVTLWEKANACAMVTFGLQPSGGRLTLTLLNSDGKGAIDATPGSYQVQSKNFQAASAGMYAAATYDDLNNKCKSSLKGNTDASSGTVVLSGANSNAYSGSFTLGFTGNDTLAGSFNAVPCPGAATNIKLGCQ